MTALSLMRKLARQSRRRRLCRSAYRGVLVQSSAWQASRQLHALLWVGIAAMVFVAAQPIIISVSGASPLLRQPPHQQVVISALAASLPATEMAQNHTDSLFSLVRPLETETLKVAATVEHSMQVPNTDDLPVVTLPRWQLQVQSFTAPETVLHALADANHYLQREEFVTARQGLLDVLARDPYQVEALAGMLLVSKKLGDRDSEQTYLERLRQAIPDYEYADEARLLSELE